MTVRVPTCSAIGSRGAVLLEAVDEARVLLGRPAAALRFSVTVSPGRGRRRVFEVWSTPAVAQAHSGPSVWVCAVWQRARGETAVFSRA